MDCKDVREHLLDLARPEGAAPAGVEEHVRGCSGCAAELEGLRSTMALLEEWQAPEVSPYFDQRLKARLREAQAEERAGGWLAWLRKPALATAFALLLAVSAMLIRGGPEQSPVEQARVTPAPTAAGPSSAVADLQALDNNEELYANFDLLDEDEAAEQDVNQ